MRAIRIVFTYPNEFQLHSWITARRLGRHYSHAAIITRDEEYELFDVCQASHGMVHEVDLDIFKDSYHFVKVFTIDLTPEQFARGRKWIKKQRGKKYSVAGMLAATVPALRSLRWGQDGDREFICSEFVFRFLEEALGIEIIPTGRGFDDYVDPAVLEGILVKMEEAQSQMGLNFQGHAIKKNDGRPEPLPVSSKGTLKGSW